MDVIKTWFPFVRSSTDITFEPASVRPPPQRQDTFAVYQAIVAADPPDDDEEDPNMPGLLSPFDDDSDEE